MTIETHAIVGGMFDGWTLRSSRRGRAQIRNDVTPWAPAPRNILARRYLSDSPVWDWLRAQGVARPNVSGPSGAHNNADREALLVRLPRPLVARLRKVAAESGRDVRTVVETAVREYTK